MPALAWRRSRKIFLQIRESIPVWIKSGIGGIERIETMRQLPVIRHAVRVRIDPHWIHSKMKLSSVVNAVAV